MEVTSWLLLLPTSACPAAHAQHSALLKLSLWAIFTTRSMPTSALSAVLAQHSALQRLSRLSKPEKTEKTRCGKTMPRFFFFQWCPCASKNKKRRCPTGERQRLFCDFVAAYCGLRSSAISVTSKEKRDGKKNQTNNVLLFI